jgi:hypothetical protein
MTKSRKKACLWSEKACLWSEKPVFGRLYALHHPLKSGQSPPETAKFSPSIPSPIMPSILNQFAQCLEGRRSNAETLNAKRAKGMETPSEDLEERHWEIGNENMVDHCQS